MSLKSELQSLTPEELQKEFVGHVEKMTSIAQSRPTEELDAETHAVIRDYDGMGRLVVGVSKLFENPHDISIAAQALTVYLSILAQVAETREMPSPG